MSPGAAAHHFVFRSTWRLPAAPPTVYDALADVEAYPSWWRQVRHVRRLDDESGEIRVRSRLPYDLVFVATQQVADAAAGTLRATLSGDLIGWSQWLIAPDGPDGSAAVAEFTEDVVVATALLRAGSRLARPLLSHNHAVMMRAGERALARRLGAATGAA